jgi:signal transduction histidine kinase
MLDRIEASLAHERAFVDDASHELRTPLSILRGELELAADRPGDRKAVEQSLRSALQEAEHLGHLTEDLLVLARADRGQFSPRLESVDLLSAARRAADRHRTPPVPVLEVSGDAVTVPADPSEVDRILDNLIANARRHAAGRVRIAVAAEGRGGVLSVADDGPGFPPEFLPVAFDRFTRADAHRGRDDGGSGLGLAIVAAMGRAHGGRVKAQNGPPLGGARVDVWFPAPTPPSINSADN